MNGPLLNDSVLATLGNNQTHTLPEAGNLGKIFIDSSHLALGFAFGPQNILSVVPMSYDIAEDSHISDASVKTGCTTHQ